MKKHLKRLLSVMLAALLCLGIVPSSVFAAEYEYDGYLAKKRAEGKHYNVALSHAAKKLVRLIFAMEKSRQPYCSAA